MEHSNASGRSGRARAAPQRRDQRDTIALGCISTTHEILCTVVRMGSEKIIPPELHELEEEVMEEIWRHEEISVRGVTEALNEQAERPRAYTTYMTIMGRLDRKGLLARRREGKTDIYRPVYTRDDYADLRAGAEIDSIVDQFGEVALAHIARQMAQLDASHRRALERLARDT